MADHANLLVLKGNLGADPKFTTMNNEREVASILVATNAPDWRDGDGKWHKRDVEWCWVSVYVPSALKALRDLRRGDPIEVRASVGQVEFQVRGTGEVRKALEIKVSDRFLGHLVKRGESRAAGSSAEAAEGAR